jgi:hypothetical protein
MPDETTHQDTMRELAHRVTDGIDVKLFWRKVDNRLTVRVRDTRSSDSFELEAPRDQALDVFYHPYAHAALRRIAYTGDRHVALPPAA